MPAITMITFFHYSVVLGLLFIPNLFYGMVSTEKELKEKYSSSKLSETEKNKIINPTKIDLENIDIV